MKINREVRNAKTRRNIMRHGLLAGGMAESQPSNPITVLGCDDHTIVREGSPASPGGGKGHPGDW
jgi:hypothetical protein